APNSTLVLRNAALASAGTGRYMYESLALCGIARNRVRMLGQADHFDFLRTYDDIDVALDTFPYGGGTTTMEAIWQGVPVVTFHGDRWASRQSASLLRAAGLGEYVVRDLATWRWPRRWPPSPSGWRGRAPACASASAARTSATASSSRGTWSISIGTCTRSGQEHRLAPGRPMLTPSSHMVRPHNFDRTVIP